MLLVGLVALVAIGFYLARDRFFRHDVATRDVAHAGPALTSPPPPATTSAALAPTPPPTPTPEPSPPPAPTPPPSVAPPPTRVAATNTTAVTAPEPRGNLTQQAQRYLERGNIARAIDTAKRATVIDPSDAEAWLTLGAAYDAWGNRAQARSAYQSCVDRGHGGRVTECRALLGQ
jgi:hypothetical protein